MPFVVIRKGVHRSDRAYLLRQGDAFLWTPRIDEATRFATEEESAALVQANPAGPAFEGGCAFEIAAAPEIQTNFGPFIVMAYIAATRRALYFAFDGVTASWPSRQDLALHFATRGGAEAVATRFSAGDGPVTTALTVAGLSMAHPVEFEVFDLGELYGRAA
ncbi:MAG: hypothetical protein J0I42_23550 [Bosea sp.]|uniref:hypothetical protein n=1 Tax=Bosea sp. (in: a-proteobacteria) TaxID=1871050 RepID=UPI001ACF94CC|nr:hypothetical protein [Bosea sp. (in: a-proteobacteria)]MBN9454928.1 hypothetical protein [Bosea sp. (in: a-proteobacteria)]